MQALNQMHHAVPAGNGTRAIDNAYAPDQDEQESLINIDIRSIWTIITRNRVLIAGTLLAALLLGFLATFLMTPQYIATTSVQIEQQAAQVLGDDQENVDPAAAWQDADRFLQTQIDILKSRAMAIRVAQSLNLFNGDAFFTQMNAEPPSDVPNIGEARREAVIKLLRDNLLVTLPVDSRIATISFESPDPQLAEHIANSFAENFIKSNLQRKYESTSYARDFLATQLDQAREKLEASERAMNAYARQAGIIETDTANERASASQGGSITTQSLQALNQGYIQAQAQRIAAEQKWRTTQATPLMSIPEVLSNQAIQQLLQRRATQIAQLEEERKRHRDNFPTVVQAQAQIDELNRQISALAQSIRNSIKDQYQAALQQEQAFSGRVNDLKSATLSEQDRSVQYNILRREVDTNRTLYEGLLNRFKEVSAAQGITANNISVIDQADAPLYPSSPKLLLNLALAGLGGVVLAFLLVFVREQLDDTVRTPADVERKAGLPVLGTIPAIGPNDDMEEALRQPKSALSEAYFAVRTALLFSTTHGTPKSLLITSSQESEGKTTTSYAVAKDLAKLGKSVLLVDADLRRPAMHRRFDIANKAGLSDFLTGQADLAHLVCETDQSNLSFLPCGPIPPSPSELLGGIKFQQLLMEGSSLYDVLVIDGPPVLGLADAPTLAGITETTMFVIEAGRNHKGRMKSSIRRLQAANAHIIGTVLTKFDAKKAGLSYEYGYSYYAYGAED